MSSTSEEADSIPLLTAPTQSNFPLFHTPTGFRQAASLLQQGRGPIAVDTERASGYRYDDRAFLIQLKRQDSGIILLDPEVHRDAFREILSPVLSQQSWIIHAAHTDLPCLAWLGCHPTELFDTELAGRLAGFSKVNLSDMCATVLGFRLAKGYGAEDWSTRPLPKDWLVYAALDVEPLLDLADAMMLLLERQGRWEYALEECEYVRRSHAHIQQPPMRSWCDERGIESLTTPHQLVIAQALWKERERLAKTRDQSPGRILRSATLIDIARTMASSPQQMKNIRGVGRQAPRWWKVQQRALSTDPTTWPQPKRSSRRGAPSTKSWRHYHPESFEDFLHCRAKVEEVAGRLNIPTENLLSPTVLRELLWEILHHRRIKSPEQARSFLHAHGARRWQIELCQPALYTICREYGPR
ncbi:ribonuclease D [Corynebacterium sp. 3HC-13]|uniref:HRDC domain-containing protein n=1 Tax=Corynebacterium poyangense TaxID=2684405 RepID=UPI001CC9606B|nr:HRDC domain-containing protein [Corynebacterium poyangense]MBZ8177920.1 ribonuclease D [Corynebacterium poyangense]